VLLDTQRTLDNCYNHPSTGPYVCKQLIQMLVTSNPSPAYVGRVVAVWNANKTSPNQLREVCRTILLDTEARGDVKTEAYYGRLRDPVQYVMNMLRPFNPLSANRTAQSDGYFDVGAVNGMAQTALRPPTVFSYFPQDYVLPGNIVSPFDANDFLRGPEFGIYSTQTTLARANYCNTVCTPGSTSTNPIQVVQTQSTVGGVPDPNGVAPLGTSIDLTSLRDLATADPTGNALADRLNQLLLHGTMSTSGDAGNPLMREKILTAVQAVPTTASNRALKQARTALYLVLTSSQYQVQR
jgi:hypothetical protein